MTHKLFKSIFAVLGCFLLYSTLVAAEGGFPKGSVMDGSLKGSPVANFTAAAIAQISGTSEDSKISGSVAFLEIEGTLMVTADLRNVPDPGKHGIHIHQNGSCDDGGKAAGGHFNPDGTQHGFFPANGPEHSHPGDMGNIEIDEDGHGTLQLTMPGLSLTDGKFNVAGKAVILHAKEDDFGQPTGNAGARIGCGIIEVSK